jgi:hypothetical protein
MIGALKQLEAGRKAEDVAREVGVSKHTIYAWKAKYGGMDVSEAQEAKQLAGWPTLSESSSGTTKTEVAPPLRFFARVGRDAACTDGSEGPIFRARLFHASERWHGRACRGAAWAESPSFASFAKSLP